MLSLGLWLAGLAGLARWCGLPRRATSTVSRRSFRIVQSKGRKDRHVMLPAEVLKLLRQMVEGAADRV